MGKIYEKADDPFYKFNNLYKILESLFKTYSNSLSYCYNTYEVVYPKLKKDDANYNFNNFLVSFIFKFFRESHLERNFFFDNSTALNFALAKRADFESNYNKFKLENSFFLQNKYTNYSYTCPSNCTIVIETRFNCYEHFSTNDEGYYGFLSTMSELDW